ncbi:hypothetical protein D4R86_02045 [bacterium]|nr:MAG: hypothetical protein D4R86_02045 [bacterium]
MNLREILQILKREWKLISILVVLALILTSIFTLINKAKYEINFSLLISQIQTQKTDKFKYDTYYALEAKDKIGDYLIGLLKSPEYVNATLKYSDLTTANFTTYNLRTFFRPYKISAQSIGVTFYLRNSNQTKDIVKSALLMANESLGKIYIPSADDAKFEIKSTNPLVSLKKPRIALNLVVVFIVSFILSSLVALIKEYFIN